MKNAIGKILIVCFIFFAFILISGCTEKEKNQEASSASSAGTKQTEIPVSGIPAPEKKAGNTVVSVNDKVLTKSELNDRVKERIKIIKAKMPVDAQQEFEGRQQEIRENLKKEVTEGFITKTLLSEEFEKRKINASTEDIKAAMDMISSSLPKDQKITQYMKENGVTNDDIIFAIKLNKFKNMEINQKAKPTKKEISKFYNENIDSFSEKESVHVRHILVAVGKDDSHTVKAQKKEKIEKIRKQLLEGGNFAELAKTNSDCPSKEFGGDMNYITRGQMIKTFEKAAFSQKKNAIGPVVNTEFGYHIIQVLDHKPAKKTSFESVKDKIALMLEKKKRDELFNDYMKKLQYKAKIIIY